MAGLTLSYNRIFIFGFSFVCLLGIYLILWRSRLGLRIRAVTQNRSMSSCLGVATGRIDALTFAMGAGVAGMAGCALSQLGTVGPGLGQTYIVDTFLVVVLGGVGKLMGTVVAAFGIGGVNKILESLIGGALPKWGPILSKVAVLVLLILFLQKKPSGLFAIKGRHAEA
jgi:urea transport system permease protein